MSPVVAALDASPSAGATVETQVSKNLAFALWRHSERKETFSRLCFVKRVVDFSDRLRRACLLVG